MTPSAGISLPPSYLNEETDHPESLLWSRLLGPPGVGLRLLREAGAEAIELRMIGPGTPVEIARRAMARAADAGFHVTLHGLLHPEGTAPKEDGAFPLWGLGDEIRGRQHSSVVTLHARFCATEKEESPARATIAALRELLEEDRRRNAPYRYALEINRMTPRADPAFTWQGVETMVAAVDDPRVGICWDLGHAHFNFLRGLIPAEPPENFVRRVIHTHIHDLGPGDRTHWPIGGGGVRVEESCRKLIAAGYKGVFNLELQPGRYAGEPRVAERILASVRLLAKLAHGD